MKKIDLHCHTYAPQENSSRCLKEDAERISTEEQIEIFDKLNVEKGVILPLITAKHPDGLAAVENCRYIADKYPDRFSWFCNIDPRAEGFDEKTDLGEYFGRYKELGAKGVG